MKDSYEEFFRLTCVTKKDFIKFGLDRRFMLNKKIFCFSGTIQRALLFVFLIIIFQTSVFALQNITITEEVKKNIKERVDNGESVGVVVGIIGSNGAREYFSYGSFSMSNNKPVNEYSIYEIGSITKVFTGVLLADLVENKIVNLDDPVEKYLPSGVKVPEKNGKKITLVSLASHTSGLLKMPLNFNPVDYTNPYADYTVKQMYEFLEYCVLFSEIGKKYSYSNLGMGLLGHVIELIHEKDYEQIVRERICNTLGMNSTFINIPTELRSNFVKGHTKDGETSYWNVQTLSGAGALRSPADDMLTFIGANLGIRKSTLTPAMNMSHKVRAKSEKMKIGLGWHIKPGKSGDIIWHNGGTGGFRTFCGFVKEKKIGVVVLSNMNISFDDVGFHLLDNSNKLKEIKNYKK